MALWFRLYDDVRAHLVLSLGAAAAYQHWDSRTIPEVSPYKEVGVVDMPLTKAAWKEIGQIVRKNKLASSLLEPGTAGL